MTISLLGLMFKLKLTCERKVYLLFLSSCIPKLNGVGWEQRAYQFLKVYSQVAEVDLICVNFGNANLSSAEHLHLTEICRSCQIFNVDQAISKVSYLKLIPRLFTAKPFLSTVTLNPHFEQELEKYLATANLIHSSRLELFAFLPKKAWKNTILDLDECHATTLRRKQKLDIKALRSLKSVIQYLDTFRIAHYQEQMVKQVRVAFICSEVERKRVGSLPELKVLPNVAKSLPSLPDLVNTQQKCLLFVGNLSGSPNIDAVLYFANEIWGKVHKQDPTCQFMIVGRNPCKEILALAGSNQINVYADVEDLGEFYRNATVAVVPLRFGAGTKLKLLEAFGYGVPVVSTSIGSEGLDIQDEVHLLIADSPDAFAQACLRLLSEVETRRRLVRAAWDFVRKAHNVEAIQQTIMENVLPFFQ